MSHVPHLITDLALILCAAGTVTLLFKKLKQPVVLGYILAGFFVGPNFQLLATVTETSSIQIWAEIGVVFLLFSLGLEFSFKKLMKVGSTALITGLFEITAMTLLGYYIGIAFGWSQINCLFLGAIIAISSTTIIFRAFDELNLKPKKFAGIVIGILVIEDLVAVLILVLLSTVAVSNSVESEVLITSILKLFFFLTLWFVGGIFLLPSFFKRAARLMSDETLLIVAIGLCLGMVLLAVGVGFSAALGAFIMGSLLAETTMAERIEHVFKPVKDLFGAVFFVSVGMLIDPAMLLEHWLPVTILTFCVVFGKTLFVTIGALLSGQPLKQSVQAGTSMSQIGEFSFIIATLGVSLQVTESYLYPIAVGVSVITTFTTPYLIGLSDPLIKGLEKIIPQRWLENLNRYSTGAQHINAESDWRNVLHSFTLIVVINSVILIAIILVFKKVVEPAIWVGGTLGSLITAASALICMSPFLWMLTTKKINKPSYTQLWLNKYNRGPIIVLEMLRVAIGIILVGLLFTQLFSTVTALATALVIMLISGVVFSRKLHAFSVKIEQRFITNFHLRESSHKPQTKVENLLPWDAHLAYFDIDIDSTLVGVPLQQLALRERFGVNIAMIERGNRMIMIPSKEEPLFPFDRIAVIGTDEQILLFKNTIESANQAQVFDETKGDISLVQLSVQPGFPFLGQTIRESAFREKAKGLIVGIERNGERILNPESTMTFQLEDTLWIAGDRKRLKIALEQGS